MGVFESLLAPVMGLTLGPLAAPLISAGTSLLGGAINAKNERKGIAAQNAYNDPAQIRARAEAAGFNPISFIGPGVGNQTAAASGAYMGSAIADAGMSVANEISKSRELGRLENLSRENAKLAAKVESLTLRPKVEGVYAQRETTPTISAAVGGGNAGNSANGTTGQSVAVSDGRGVDGTLRPLPETLPIDPRRGVDNAKITSSSGFMVVDTPLLPFPVYFPTADGDEPLQWYDYPSVALPVAGSFIYHEMNKPAEPLARYRVPGVMASSQKARVIGGGNISASPNPAKRAAEVAAIKAVDPSYGAGSSPSWHKYRQKAWWQ